MRTGRKTEEKIHFKKDNQTEMSCFSCDVLTADNPKCMITWDYSEHISRSVGTPLTSVVSQSTR